MCARTRYMCMRCDDRVSGVRDRTLDRCSVLLSINKFTSNKNY